MSTNFRYYRQTLRRLAGLGLIATLATAPGAQAQPALLYILDASGSMWGRINGEAKIDSAKTVLKELLDQTPSNVDVGPMAYGHRRKGDCTDIELIAPAGSERTALQQRISAINPKGRTPISEALAQAGRELPGREDETSLVLVSDGLETCSGDPCAVARQLREQGHKLVIHVVGLEVDKEASAQLQCIAQAGGGRYFPAQDSSGLRDALVYRPSEHGHGEIHWGKVTVPEHGMVNVALDSGIRFIHETDSKAPYRIFFINLDTQQEIVMQGTWEPQPLPPGRYRMDWWDVEHGSKRETLVDELPVEAGVLLEMEI